jgi:hypothetical protein
MSTLPRSFFPALCLATFSRLGAADPASADKSNYSFTHPVPADQLRELNTDRPDATEGPYTIDPGHVQLELDFASFTRNRLDGQTTREWSALPFNLRFGILSNFELGVFLEPYRHLAEQPRGGPNESRSGFGDLTVRTKFNFRGNDDEGTALGLILDVKLPTAHSGLGNDAVEGALIFPVAGKLGRGWEFGAMTEVEFRHRDGGGTSGVWINSATVGHELGRATSGYLELTSEAGEGPHVATFNLGLTFRLDANTQLDGGVNLGVSRAADDAQFFTGISRRF